MAESGSTPEALSEQPEPRSDSTSAAAVSLAQAAPQPDGDADAVTDAYPNRTSPPPAFPTRKRGKRNRAEVNDGDDDTVVEDGEAAEDAPPVPELPELDEDDWRFDLQQGVKRALMAVPNYFQTKTTVTGLDALDLFTLNTSLGATIEQQIVETLNNMREVWDPDKKFGEYRFARYSQTFPDVRLERNDPDGSTQTAFAIELKGWYLLSGEGEPSYRYKVNEGFCSDWDLLVVVPWYLDNVLSGVPVVLPPAIRSAKWAAKRRNYFWQYEKDTKASREIKGPPNVWLPPRWPTKRDKIVDTPAHDPSNFGRLSRTRAMDDWLEAQRRHLVAGIPAKNWIKFFRMHTEAARGEIPDAKLDNFAKAVKKDPDDLLPVERD